MSTEVVVARWSASELAKRCGGRLEGDPTATVVAVTTDSRKSREGSAFFALDGARSRGSEFVPAAFGSGCSVVVVPNDWVGEVPEDRAVLRVEDPLTALADVARSVREGWEQPVLAITGSSGKTTVKEMTAHVLEARHEVHRTPGNLNTVVGLSCTILERGEPTGPAVYEVGASEPGEIARLAAIARPTAAAVTNVGAAHLEGFGSLEGVMLEKVSLLEAVEETGLRLVDGDNPALVAAAGKLKGKVLTVGLGPDCDLRASHLENGSRGLTAFQVVAGPEVHLSVPGDHQVKNALFALAFGMAHDVPLDEGAARLATFHGVAGRLALLRTRGITVVDDAYNSNPASLAAALDWFAPFQPEDSEGGRKAVALGDMLELGTDSEKYHREVGARLAELDFDLVVFVGPESRAAFEETTKWFPDSDRFLHVADSARAARALQSWVRPGDAVLVKGSRGMRMERVVRALTEGESTDAL